MSNFRSLKGGCPICNGARKDCRENTTNGMVHCRCDDIISSPGFRRIGRQDSLGFNMWAPHDGKSRNDVDWEEVRQRRAAEREERERADKQRHSQSLSIEERDCNIREMSRQLGLKPYHQQNLRERGLTDEQIGAGLYFSVGAWQRVDNVNPLLAGVSADGRILLFGNPGIGCPISDTAGRIIGYQIRFDDGTSGRYRWPTSRNKQNSSGSTSHLQSGELPLGCYRPRDEVTRQAIGLAEGHLKPFVAAQKLGQVVIGAAGGNHAGSPQQMRAYLDALGSELDTKVLTLYADAGSVLNSSVLRQYRRTVDLVTGWGFTVQFAWWGQVSKTDKDVDELDNFDGLKYLSVEEFFQLAAREQYLQQVAHAQRRLNALTYHPDILLDEQYLPKELWKLLPNSGIVCLKARKGGGKSSQLKELIAYYRNQGRKVISLTPRIALGREQAEKWKIAWIDNVGLEGNHFVTVGLLRQEQAIGLCWDSLWKLSGRDWSDAVVILDESEQGVKHVATSSTCTERRAFIMSSFEKLIQQVLSTDGLVMLSDADLTNVSVDYIKALAPENTKVFTVVNTHRGKPWNVRFFTGKRGTAEQEIVDNLACGIKTIVPTDSQGEAEALERKLLEQYPAAKIVRIDRKTCAEKWAQDFVKNPNESIEKIQPDLLVYTPSMGTGVSIDTKYFQSMVAMFFAVIEPTEAAQMLARVRDTSIPRTVWCKEANYDVGGCKSHLPEVIEKEMLRHHEATVLLLDVAASLSANNEDDAVLLEKLNSLFDKKQQKWRSKHISLYSNIKARRNFGLSQFSVQLHQQLLEEGHTVTVEEGEKSSAGEQIKGAKLDIKLEEAAAIANAEEIGIEQAQVILSSPHATETQRLKARRAVLKESLPGVDLTPEFIFKSVIHDHGRWLAQQQLFWRFKHPTKTAILDRRNWRRHLAKIQIYLPDVKTSSLQVDTLKALGVEKFLDPSIEYCASDDLVQQFMRTALDQKHKVKAAFDLTVTEKTDPTQFLGRLLKRIGLKTQLTRKEGGRDEQVRYYRTDQATFNDPDRLNVLASLCLKYEALSDDFYPQSGSHHSLYYLNNKVSGDYRNCSPKPAPDMSYTPPPATEIKESGAGENQIIFEKKKGSDEPESLPLEVVQTQPLVAELGGQGVVIAKAPTLPFVLELGALLRDSAGNVLRLAQVAAGGFLTNRGEHVSRNDLTSGLYRPLNPACAEDVSLSDVFEILSNFGETIQTYNDLLIVTEVLSQKLKRQVWSLLPLGTRQHFRNLKLLGAN